MSTDDANAKDTTPEACDKCRNEVAPPLIDVDDQDFAAVDWRGDRRAPTARRVCRDCCRG